MAIPDFQTIMLPLLQFLSDGQEHSNKEIHDHLAQYFQLTPEEINMYYPTGNAKIFYDRITWAKSYLKKAGLVTYERRGFAQITPSGIDLLKENINKINLKLLSSYEDSKGGKGNKQKEIIDEEGKTPEEYFEIGYKLVTASLIEELIKKIKNCSPEFFEKLVLDLLLAMGYGGSRQEAAQVLGRSGDEGIDGLINEDKLGLDSIYIQAKHWDTVVGRPEIQKFAGALEGKRAKKGIFITTSSFSKDAQDYVKKIEKKIVLIDGQYLARLMIDHDIGVTKVRSYDLKRLDSDYFTED